MHVTKIERSDSSAVQCCTGVDKVAVIVALFWVHYNIPTYFLLTFLLTYIEVTVECHGASTYNVRDTSHVLGRFFVVLHLDAHLVLVPVICVADQVVVLVLISSAGALTSRHVTVRCAGTHRATRCRPTSVPGCCWPGRRRHRRRPSPSSAGSDRTRSTSSGCHVTR